MKCKKCGRWINDFHDRRCPARSDAGDNRVKEIECDKEQGSSEIKLGTVGKVSAGVNSPSGAM